MTDKNLASKLVKEFTKLDPHVDGSVFVHRQDNTLMVTGELATSLPVDETLTAILSRIAPGSSVLLSVKARLEKPVLRVVVAEDETRESAHSDCEELELDQVRNLFLGEVPLEVVQHNEEYKRENWNTYRKVANSIEVLGAVAPLVLDRNLKVIDGNLRLSIAKELGHRTVPAMILDVDDVKAAFLRLVLNRSSEFQKWLYEDVDPFVDSVPQLQPLLEPLGFFGERLLPVSFFGDTILQYKIDEYNTQQKQYRQEIGLAQWAEIQRARVEAEEAARKKPKKKSDAAPAVSLFDLMPQEQDFLQTHDVKSAMTGYVHEMRDMAGTITDNYDAKRRAEKEAKGQAWQTSRRSSKKVAADNRAAATLDEELDE